MEGLVAVHNHREGVDGLLVDEHVQAHQVTSAVGVQLVIKRCIAAGFGFKRVVKVYNQLGQWNEVGQRDSVRRRIFLADVFTTALGYQLHDRPDIAFGRNNLDPHPWLTHFVNRAFVRQLRRRVDAYGLGGTQQYLIHHRWRGHNQVEVVLAFKPFLHNLHVKQAEESAAEAKVQRL